ncbi:MAG: NUDIX domain-containing protein [Rikenellaceae bacterium]
MENSFDIYFATNRLAIATSLVDGITTTISPEMITSAEELCRMLNTHQNIAIVTDSPSEVLETISQLFIAVTAAGGIATNDQGLDLMIYRNGRWDLPKGHWEEGETIEECALREVEEETGVKGLTIGNKICTTSHIYKMKGRWEIKCTHWFRMTTSHSEELIPQTEEGIERVAWCSKEEIMRFLPDSFPTIQQVYRKAQINDE